MCLILFAINTHPDYPLVLAANRDELHARPTRQAQWWDDSPDLLAGQDLTAGGTWLGVSRSGRLAAITNYRDPLSHDPAALSRGVLTRDFLQQEISPDQYRQQLLKQGAAYNGYNLLFGTVEQLHYFSNRGTGPERLNPGVYGLSNHLLDTLWPKVRRGKQALSEVLKQNEPKLTDLWQVLADPTIANDSDLPETGISLEWERTLSAIRIVGDHYGTRTSTLLLVNKKGLIQFTERTLEPSGKVSEVSYNFDRNA